MYMYIWNAPCNKHFDVQIWFSNGIMQQTRSTTSATCLLYGLKWTSFQNCLLAPLCVHYIPSVLGKRLCDGALHGGSAWVCIVVESGVCVNLLVMVSWEGPREKCLKYIWELFGASLLPPQIFARKCENGGNRRRKGCRSCAAADRCPSPSRGWELSPLSQDGAREDLLNDDTGILRLTQRKQKSRVGNKVKSQLDWDFQCKYQLWKHGLAIL